MISCWVWLYTYSSPLQVGLFPMYVGWFSGKWWFCEFEYPAFCCTMSFDRIMTPPSSIHPAAFQPVLLPSYYRHRQILVHLVCALSEWCAGASLHSFSFANSFHLIIVQLTNYQRWLHWFSSQSNEIYSDTTSWICKTWEGMRRRNRGTNEL